MTTIEDRDVVTMVEDAAAAPSMHNAQPWRFRHHRSASTVDVVADTARAMPHADPDLRALHLGCGAALFNLRVGAAQEGFGAGLEILPDPADPAVLARVHLGEGPGDTVLAALHPALEHRHTSRVPFSEAAVAGELRFALAGEAAAEGARLSFPKERQAAFLLDLIAEAEEDTEKSGDPDARSWTRVGQAPELGAEDGVPFGAVGPRRRRAGDPVRDFAGGTGRERVSVDFEPHPQLALVSTTRDEPADWLAAGQATERVLLTATQAHLATGLDTQVLERPELRALLRAGPGDQESVQMVVRLGYGPRGTPTPRRPASEILDRLP